MTTHEIIVRGHALLVKHGLRKHHFGSLYDGDGICARGAYMYAEHGQAGMEYINADVENALCAAAGIKWSFGGYSIATWTNEDCRTEAEVLDVFARAAEATAPDPPVRLAATPPQTITKTDDRRTPAEVIA